MASSYSQLNAFWHTQKILGEVAANRIDIQLHTHRHRTPLDEILSIWEIRQNRQWIREQLFL